MPRVNPPERRRPCPKTIIPPLSAGSSGRNAGVFVRRVFRPGPFIAPDGSGDTALSNFFRLRCQACFPLRINGWSPVGPVKAAEAFLRVCSVKKITQEIAAGHEV